MEKAWENFLGIPWRGNVFGRFEEHCGRQCDLNSSNACLCPRIFTRIVPIAQDALSLAVPLVPERPSLTIFTRAHLPFILTSSTSWFSFQHLPQYVIEHWVIYCVGVCLSHWHVSSEKSSCSLLSPHLPGRASTEQMLSALLSTEWMLVESLLMLGTALGVVFMTGDQKSGIEAANRESRGSYLVPSLIPVT